MFDLVSLGELIALGFGLAGVGSLLVAQCGGNKRASPKKKGQISKKSLSSSSKSGKKSSKRASKKSIGSSKSGKKSSRSSSKKSTSSKKLSKTQSLSSKKVVAPKKSVTQVTKTPARVSKTVGIEKPRSVYYNEQDWSKQLMSELHVEMRTLKFNTEASTVKLPIHNPTQDRYAFKVKCSDNCLFRVNPVFSFVEPGSTVYINVARCAAASKQDRIIIETAKVPESSLDPRTVFKQPGKFPKILLPITA